MLSLRERVHAEIDALTDAELGYILETIADLKSVSRKKWDLETPELNAFEVLRLHAQDIPELTIDEINEEIRAARTERKLKPQKPLDSI